MWRLSESQATPPNGSQRHVQKEPARPSPEMDASNDLRTEPTGVFIPLGGVEPRFLGASEGQAHAPRDRQRRSGSGPHCRSGGHHRGISGTSVIPRPATRASGPVRPSATTIRMESASLMMPLSDASSPSVSRRPMNLSGSAPRRTATSRRPGSMRGAASSTATTRNGASCATRTSTNTSSSSLPRCPRCGTVSRPT